MSLEEETLIDLVEKFTHLWDKRNPQFKDKIAIENSWKTISQIMKITDVYRFFTALSTVPTFYLHSIIFGGRMPRDMEISSSEICGRKESPEKYSNWVCSWVLYEKMGFLDSAITTRRTKSNILKNEEINPNKLSEVWESMVVVEGGELVSQDFLEDIENLDEDETVGEENYPKIPVVTKQRRGLQNVTNDIQNLGKEKQEVRKRKPDIPLDELVQTCTSVGKSLNTFLSNPSGTDRNVGQDDHYFSLSVADSNKL